MKKDIVKRVMDITNRLLETKQTIRELSKEFNISKSTVHKDLHERLALIDKNKYIQVKKIMQQHINIRHIKGGESTRKKYCLK